MGSSLLRFLSIVGVAALFFATGRSGAEDKKPADPNRQPILPNKAEVMKAKLKASEALLSGLALEDYKKIEESATELARISRAAEFLNAHKGNEYQFQAVLFQRTAETMAKKAKDKNIDGVLVSLQEMTNSCVKCHKAFRDDTK